MTLTEKRELLNKIDKELKTHDTAYKKMYTKESAFQTKLISVLKEIFGETIWFTKVSDKYIKGIPDIMGCIDGKFFALELKRDKGVPSKLQLYNIDKIKKAGGQVCIVKTVAESLEIIKCILMM